MRFTAKIIDGKIAWHNNKALDEFLYKNDTMECYIDIKPSKVRNTAQNNYYWAILKEFGKQCGYHAEEMHDVCKVHFKIGSTKEMNIDEFSDYIDRVIMYAAEQGFPVRDPRRSRFP
tara:strand:- start:333 stop:683 length:351 start_codon:yes stop_codon:yes gene_type:complete